MKTPESEPFGQKEQVIGRFKKDLADLPFVALAKAFIRHGEQISFRTNKEGNVELKGSSDASKRFLKLCEWGSVVSLATLMLSGWSINLEGRDLTKRQEETLKRIGEARKGLLEGDRAKTQRLMRIITSGVRFLVGEAIKRN